MPAVTPYSRSQRRTPGAPQLLLGSSRKGQRVVSADPGTESSELRISLPRASCSPAPAIGLPDPDLGAPGIRHPESEAGMVHAGTLCPLTRVCSVPTKAVLSWRGTGRSDLALSGKSWGKMGFSLRVHRNGATDSTFEDEMVELRLLQPRVTENESFSLPFQAQCYHSDILF